jgi:hypothetical protein
MKSFLILIIFSLGLYANSQDYPAYHLLDNEEKVDYLWSLYLDEELDPVLLHQNIFNPKELSVTSQLRLKAMLNSFRIIKDTEVIYIKGLNYSEALKLASEWLYYGTLNVDLDPADKALVEKAKRYIQSLKKFRTKSKDEVHDLVFNGANLGQYSQGQYLVKLFLFCRHDRRYSCRFVLKDRFDQLVRNKDGSVWSLPALAHSSRELPYYITNGYTPSGVHSMDSVMPEPNRPRAFGQFRRVILNWIPKGRTSELLPNSALDKKWWKEASLARNNKRKYLRIHGTGKLNTDTDSSFYPHVPTAGCISTREGKYPMAEYTDQRKILDKIMQAQNLLPSYNNETKIKGILYVMELDNLKKPVTEATLRKYGIR